MDLKTAEYLTKLMLEDDEDDGVSFAFPNEKRKIKCSISMLCEISPVFEAMFSARWSQEKSGDNQLDSVLQQDETVKLDDNQLDLFPHQDKTVKLEDDVKFDQCHTFKLLMQILYGLRQINSLSVDQAIGVYFYTHKYQIKDVEDKIQKFLNERMESGLSKRPLSVKELKDGIEFAQMYQLDEFKNKLDRVKLAFDEVNPMQYMDLANQFEMKTLKKQVVDHVKTIAPKEDWSPDILREVITCLQAQIEDNKKTLKELKSSCTAQTEYITETGTYSLYCGSCGYSNKTISNMVDDIIYN